MVMKFMLSKKVSYYWLKYFFQKDGPINIMRRGGIPHIIVEDQTLIPQNLRNVCTIDDDNIASLKLQTNLIKIKQNKLFLSRGFW